METKNQPKKNPGYLLTQTPSNLSDKVQIKSHSIPWTTITKYLGVTLDNKLTWAKAIEKRTAFFYPALTRIYLLIARSLLKKNIKILLHLTKYNTHNYL